MNRLRALVADRERMVAIAAYAWMLAIALCILGSAKIFGAVAVLLLGYLLHAERESGDRLQTLMVTAITALAIFFGVKQL